MAEVLRFEKGSTRLRIQKWDVIGDDARLLVSCDVRADREKQSDREFRLAAQTLSSAGREQVMKEDLWLWVRAFLDGESAEPVVLTRPDRPFRVRGISSSESTAYVRFPDALAAASPGSVIEWDDIDGACALDLDFRATASPGREALALAAEGLRPQPAHWWVTRSEGLRALYLRGPTLPADVLAGVAALEMLSAFPEAGLELLTRTRAPASEVHGDGRQIDESLDAVRRLRGRFTATDAEYADWLTERGWEVGGRYEHAHCPARPGARAEGNSPPVHVHDDHVFCFVCAADGVCHGSHAPGFFPAARLCGGYQRSLFSLCVDRLTHWEHARHVVAGLPGLYGRDRLARSIYRASLIHAHGMADPRVEAALIAGENLVRYEGYWGDTHGKAVTFREDRPQRLSELPAVAAVEDGQIRPRAVAVEWLRHSGDISRYGYPSVVPVWGFHVSWRVDPEDWRASTVLQTRGLQGDDARERRARYVGGGDVRADPGREERAWDVIGRSVPGFNRAAVELLLVAKGIAELGSGMPPFVFLTGPTGSGKSATIKLAAAIAGDHVTEVPYTSNVERLRAGLLSAKRQGTFAAFDEYVKGAAREKRGAAQSMEVLLNFTPDSESHMLYVGPVPLGTLPVCVWCDASMPREIAEHAQIARRLAWVKLPSTLRWEPTLQAAGLPGPEALRTHGDPELVEACDVIVSAVSDRWFSSGAPLFRDVVRALGFGMVEDMDASKEREQAVRDFFAEVAAAPDLTGAHATRWGTAGWKFVDLNSDGRLTQLWQAVADPSGYTSRTLEEADLAAVCRLRSPTKFDVRRHGASLVVRFARDDGGKVYNGDLYAVELQADGSGVHGPGDAVGSVAAGGGSEGIPTVVDDAPPIGGVPSWAEDRGVGADGPSAK